MAGVLRSEWIKLRSVRSTAWSYTAAAATLLFFGSIAAAFSGGLLAATEEGADGSGGRDPTGIVLSGVPLVALRSWLPSPSPSWAWRRWPPS